MGADAVITGVGAVNAFGAGVDALAAALVRGEPRLSEIDLSEGFHLPGSSRTAAIVKDVPYHEWIPPMVARRMSPPSRFAVVAANLALADANLETQKEKDPSISVTLATAFGPSSYTQRLLDQIFDEGPESISPFLYAECVANAPAAQVSIQMKATGPNHTLSENEAGQVIVVGRGAYDIRCERTRRCLVGSVEEMTPLLHSLLDRFRALARNPSGGPELARPLDRRRNGFIAAEGATILVMERDDEARARGAQILARVRGWGSGYDASASRVGWGRGVAGLSRSLRRCLSRSGVELRDIDMIVSGASGSRAGDRLEAATLRAAWEGRDLPPVIVPKAITGEYGGTFLGAAVLAAQGRPIHSGGSFEEPDAELGLCPYTGPPIVPRRVLVSTLASGGCGSWLVLERP